jgi:hypothetical protein
MSATANVIFGKPYEERTQLFLPVAAGKTDELLTFFFDSPFGLPFTAAQPGCLEIHVSKGTQADEETGATTEYVAATGFWAKKGDFAVYFATPERADGSEFKTTLGGALQVESS